MLDAQLTSHPSTSHTAILARSHQNTSLCLQLQPCWWRTGACTRALALCALKRITIRRAENVNTSWYYGVTGGFVVLCLDTFKVGTLARTKEAESRTALKWLLSSSSFSQVDPEELIRSTGFSSATICFLPCWPHFNATVLFSDAAF